ncbi:uncharacterized protein LOC111041076 [Myzus persicae]|uniref:uncharacterized protein LOC111041076 n=1 Tax=Myzus persicae TaxID=13164 RepID=UPI000B92F951|nr:uncharacterized protein LOC111041076 [Myzus persicae]
MAIDVTKSDGDEIEPSATSATVKSAAAAAEQPLQDRRRPSITSRLGNRLLKVGRLLFCCCCRPNNND